jgi:isopenicillin N synthase-like dioxygenase
VAEDKLAFADALGRSFRETGFAVISEHPVSQSVIDANLKATKDFFALPEETKLKYDGREGGGQRGYTAFGTWRTPKAKPKPISKEFWHTGRALPADSPYRETMADTPSVPEVPDSFDAATRGLYDALDGFGRQLLRAVALHLKLEESWFEDKVDVGNSILRLLHYPPQTNPPPEGSVRAGRS